jgi:hypothetical protein
MGQEKVMYLPNNISVDPLFADAASGDFHLEEK